MNPIATADTFRALSAEQAARLIGLLGALRQLNLFCRCEKVGYEIVVTVGQGLAHPQHWLDRFNIDEPTVKAVMLERLT